MSSFFPSAPSFDSVEVAMFCLLNEYKYLSHIIFQRLFVIYLFGKLNGSDRKVKLKVKGEKSSRISKISRYVIRNKCASSLEKRTYI